jgi:hypothetical protein
MNNKIAQAVRMAEWLSRLGESERAVDWLYYALALASIKPVSTYCGVSQYFED